MTTNEILDELIEKANDLLHGYAIGEFYTLTDNEEKFSDIYQDAYRSYLEPSLDDNLLHDYRSIFWNTQNVFANDNLESSYIVCLCRVKEIIEAKKNGSEWSPPQLIIENVSNHKFFNFASITKGYRQLVYYTSIPPRSSTVYMPIMPFLTRSRFGSIPSKFLPSILPRKSTILIEEGPIITSSSLHKCSKSEAVTLMNNIKKNKEKREQKIEQMKKQQQIEDSINEDILNDIYRQI